MHGAKIIHKCLGWGGGVDTGLRPPSLQLTSPQLLIPQNGFLHTLNCHNVWNWHDETFKMQIRDKKSQKTPDHTHPESKHFPNEIVKNKEQVG